MTIIKGMRVLKLIRSFYCVYFCSWRGHSGGKCLKWNDAGTSSKQRNIGECGSPFGKLGNANATLVSCKLSLFKRIFTCEPCVCMLYVYVCTYLPLQVTRLLSTWRKIASSASWFSTRVVLENKGSSIYILLSFVFPSFHFVVRVLITLILLLL